MRTLLSVRRASLAATVLLTALTACGGGGSDTTGVGPTPPPVTPVVPAPTPTTTVMQFDSTVDAPTRANVVAFLSANDSVLARGTVAMAATAVPAVAFSLNGRGEPLLMSWSSAGSMSPISPATTAELLPQLLMPFKIADTVTFLRSIRAHPLMPALTDSIRALAARNESYQAAPATLRLAATIAAAALDAATPVSLRTLQVSLSTALAAVDESKPVFVRHSAVKIIQPDPPLDGAGVPSGGRIQFENDAYVPFFILVSGPTPQRVVLLPKQLCVFCVEAITSGNIGHVGTAEVTVAQDGIVPVTLGADWDAYQRMMTIDMVSGFGRTLGAVCKEDGCKVTLSLLESGFALLGANGTKPQSLSDAATAAANAALGISEQLVNLVFKRAGKESSKVLPLLLAPLKVLGGVDAVLGVTRQSLAISTAVFKYASEEPEIPEACFEEGRLYGGCSARVDVIPAALTLDASTPSGVFRAEVFDSKGRIMPARKVRWTSANQSEVAVGVRSGDATATPDARSTSTVATRIAPPAPRAPSTVAVTATAARVTGQAVALAVPDSTALYTAAMPGDWVEKEDYIPGSPLIVANQGCTRTYYFFLSLGGAGRSTNTSTCRSEVENGIVYSRNFPIVYTNNPPIRWSIGTRLVLDPVTNTSRVRYVLLMDNNLGGLGPVFLSLGPIEGRRAYGEYTSVLTKR